MCFSNQIASYAGNEKLLTLLMERSADPNLQVIKSHNTWQSLLGHVLLFFLNY